jgi:hypothetical protein
MDQRDRTVMILGGRGLRGHARPRALLATAPRRLAFAARFAAQGLVERAHARRSHILSVGLPILRGERITR